MSARNSRIAKAKRRHVREIRHVGGCAICGSTDVAWCSEKDAADVSYRAICRVHLCYAVSTLLVGENPGPQKEDLPESWIQQSKAKAFQKTRKEKTKPDDDPLDRFSKPPDPRFAVQNAIQRASLKKEDNATVEVE